MYFEAGLSVFLACFIQYYIHTIYKSLIKGLQRHEVRPLSIPSFLMSKQEKLKASESDDANHADAEEGNGNVGSFASIDASRIPFVQLEEISFAGSKPIEKQRV